MRIRKKGKINEIIYDETMYNNGKYIHYTTLNELIHILKKNPLKLG